MFVVAKQSIDLSISLKRALRVSLLTPPCDRESPGIPWGAPGSCRPGSADGGSEHLGETPCSSEACQGDSFGAVPDDHVSAVVPNWKKNRFTTVTNSARNMGESAAKEREQRDVPGIVIGRNFGATQLLFRVGSNKLRRTTAFFQPNQTHFA